MLCSRSSMVERNEKTSAMALKPPMFVADPAPMWVSRRIAVVAVAGKPMSGTTIANTALCLEDIMSEKAAGHLAAVAARCNNCCCGCTGLTYGGGGGVRVVSNVLWVRVVSFRNDVLGSSARITREEGENESFCGCRPFLHLP